MFQKTLPHKPYKGLKTDEPVGFVWRSRAQMYFWGAHAVLVSAIHSQNLEVFSIIENGDSCNKYIDGLLHYVGHGSEKRTLCKFNLAMATTAISGTGFRFYIGPDSTHPHKEPDCYKLLGIVFIHDMYCEPFQREQFTAKGFEKTIKQIKTEEILTTSFQFQWKFVISTQFPSAMILSKLKDIAYQFSE